MSQININDYKYKYEMHLHTSEGSACGNATGAEMARCHKEAGYAGIYVTDHAWGGNTAIDRSLPYKEWVKQFSRGYYNALNEGEKIGLDVFFGFEAGFQGTEFLIYGLSPEWLMEHEELWYASIEEQYNIVKASGGLVSQAHPYRDEAYIPEVRVFPQFADAIEVDNATHTSPLSGGHRSDEWNKDAWKLALDNNKLLTAGSDIHRTTPFGGGLLFKRRFGSSSELVKAIYDRESYLLCDGVVYHDMMGNEVGRFVD